MALLKKRIAGALATTLIAGQLVGTQNILMANEWQSEGWQGEWSNVTTGSSLNIVTGKDSDSVWATTPGGLKIQKIAGFDTGVSSSDGGAAEIIKFNPDNNKFYLINGVKKTLQIVGLEMLLDNKQEVLEINIADELEDRDSTFKYGDITSVAINTKKDLIAVAVQHATYNASGKAVLMDYDGNIIEVFETGVQPDMITFTPDGRYLLTADEGEPRNGYGEGVEDPKGSITLVDITKGAENAKHQVITFEKYDTEQARAQLVADKVLLKKDAKPSQDLEPEYITVSSDSTMAYISLQEANAIATLDIQKGEIIEIKGLGFKDHSQVGNEIDLAKDGQIHITTASVYGVYMPDGLASYEVNGKTYLLTPNEGDAREYVQKDMPHIEKENEHKNIKDYKFEVNGKEYKADILDPSKIDGLDSDKNYILGGRSFSIWDADTMTLVFDSGSDFEKITAQVLPEYFNASNKNNELDNRSGKKGPEPEDVKVGEIAGRMYAFIGIERIGGVMMYDITDPFEVTFESYINSRDFSEAMKGDVAPEGLDFISAEKSPTGRPLLLVANEVSGTVSIFEVQTGTVEDTVDLTLFHTNDMHGRVKADANTIGIDTIASIRNSVDQSMLLDAGDTIHGLPFATLNQGEDIIDLMKLADYDVMTPGNHEFNYGYERLVELSEKASSGTNQLNIIAANVFEGDDTLFDTQHIEWINGVKVGVFGLATEETTYKTNPTNIIGIEFTNPVEEAKAQVASLKEQGADVIVALSHVGTDTSSNPTSEMIAQEVEGIDVIIDGHSHSKYDTGYQVGDTLIASTGEYGQQLGKVTITVDKKTKQVTDKSASLITKAEANQYQADSVIQAEIKEISERQDVVLSEVIGVTNVDLDGARENVRVKETNLGNLITDAMRDTTGADIAITNGGGIRASIPAGEITKGQVIEVLPFGNFIVTKKITGAQIKEILEHGVSAYPASLGGFAHVSGLTFKFDPEQEQGKKVFDITVGDENINMNQTYLVATNDFLAAGGDNYPHFGEAKTENEFAALDEALISYIQKLEQVEPKVEGRIVVETLLTDSNNGNGGTDNNNTSTSGTTSNKSEQVTPASTLFKDVVAGAWYEPAVSRLVHQGIMNGRGNGKIEPQAQVTRAEAAKMIALALGYTNTTSPNAKFSDVNQDAWYAVYVNALSAAGIVNGDQGKFNPNAEITREEMATMIARAMKNLPSTSKHGFTDVEANHWATPSISALAAAGIVEGKNTDKFDGKGLATRAEFAVIIDRAMNYK